MKRETPKKTASPAVTALQTASKGLRMPSETDAPFEAFDWGEGGELTNDRVVQLARAARGTAVEQSTLDDLLTAVPTADRPKFDKLRQALTQQLSGVRVYKVGDEAERQVYIVGRGTDGHWAGLKTTVVET